MSLNLSDFKFIETEFMNEVEYLTEIEYIVYKNILIIIYTSVRYNRYSLKLVE